MFGNNPVRKLEHEADGQELWVQDVFGTIQGEGPFAGRSSVFVRLAGCGLRCYFCDTDFESSSWHPPLDQLLERIELERTKVPKARLIVLTGGEPLRQNIVPLCKVLIKGGWTVQVETAGYAWPIKMTHLMSQAHGKLVLVCSPKTPKLHPKITAHCRVFKYIVRSGELSRTDGLPTMSTQSLGLESVVARPSLGAAVYVQPMDEGSAVLNAANLKAASDSAMKFGYRLGIQMHKIANLP